MIFYTSDLHFGNDFTRRRSNRPFSSTDEMDAALIRNWNALVTDTDTVFVVGDLGTYEGDIPAAQLSLLKGHKHLIRGNYDSGYTDQQSLFQFFETVTDFNEIEDNGQHIMLCHYPVLYTKRGMMIHGHLHASKEQEWEILNNLPRILNCGVDVNHYRPVPLDELIRNNQIFYGSAEKGSKTIRRSVHKVPPKIHFEPLPQPQISSSISSSTRLFRS